MTKSQLKNLGIIPEKSKLHPNRYWCNVTQNYIDISRNDSDEQIIQQIYDSGVNDGIKEGKEQRSSQILSLLTNNDIR